MDKNLNSNSETYNLQREDWKMHVRCVLDFISR